MEARSPDSCPRGLALPDIQIRQPQDVANTPASSVVFEKSPAVDRRQTTASSHASSSPRAADRSPVSPTSSCSPRRSPHLVVPNAKQKAFSKRRSLSLLSSQSETHIKAHETRKSFQRPKFWVLSFGWFLASCAGFVNTCAFLGWGMFASHMTGTSSKIGLHLEGYHHKESTLLDMHSALALVFSFVLGSFTCGLLIDKNQVHFGGKSWYGVALVGNALLIFSAALIPNQRLLSVCLIATACGLQNAMCTSHFGAVVRTTHVTGTLTDIGSTLGRIAMVFLRKGCRRSRMNVLEKAEIGVDARKLLVLLPMWICFVVGSTLGAYAENAFGVYALFFPASMTLTIGLVYMFLRQLLADMFNRIEQEGLKDRLKDMHAAFQRAGTRLSEVEGADTSEIQALDEEMGNMLEALDEVETGVDNICHLSSHPCVGHEKTPIHGVAEI